MSRPRHMLVYFLFSWTWKKWNIVTWIEIEHMFIDFTIAVIVGPEDDEDILEHGHESYGIDDERQYP